MATLGIEMCDAGFQAATSADNTSLLLTVPDANGATDWPGFAYYDGQKFAFGRAAEDQWFVHPRRVTHAVWSRLTHEPSVLGPVNRPAAYSELAFHFFRDFVQRAMTAAGPADKIVLAVPGGYLKDTATEEEKIGLLLGMAGELKLPLAGVVDSACAALCDLNSGSFNPSLPVVVVDLQLEGAELTVFSLTEALDRKDYIALPQSGYARLLKHLTATIGNRFLRHTTFDILEDGRIEQTFFRQAKDFLLSDAAEYRFQINTAARGYEMLAKRDQLVADAQQFVTALAQGIEAFVHNSTHVSGACTVALTERASHLPGLEARLRAAGFNRILRLARGAAASGAVRLGDDHLQVAADLADAAVETNAPAKLARRSATATWEARLQKIRIPGPRPSPTHVILDGIGHPLGNAGRFTIGTASAGADLPLPDVFNHVDACAFPLLREGGRLWFIDTAVSDPAAVAHSARTAIEAGDHLTIRCGTASTNVLFAHCAASHGAHAQN